MISVGITIPHTNTLLITLGSEIRYQERRGCVLLFSTIGLENGRTENALSLHRLRSGVRGCRVGYFPVALWRLLPALPGHKNHKITKSQNHRGGGSVTSVTSFFREFREFRAFRESRLKLFKFLKLPKLLNLSKFLSPSLKLTSKISLS